MTTRNHTITLALAIITLLTASTLHAATLLMHYDVSDPNSWNGTVVQDLQSFGNDLTPDDGVGGVGYAAPVYVASGASLPESEIPKPAADRAYLDFQDYGVLIGSGKDQNIFHTPTALDNGTNANVAGYTLEGMFLLRTGYSATVNTGIGFSQSTNGENQLIRVPGGTNTTLASNSCVDNAQGGPQSLEQQDTNINSIIPRDEWFHFVKVHDPVADQIRFYINGTLQAGLTFTLDGDSSAVEYHAFGLNYAAVGQSGREIRDIGYSMTRYYRGALTQEEITANFLAVTTVPEPATALMLLALTGITTLRRRR